MKKSNQPVPKYDFKNIEKIIAQHSETPNPNNTSMIHLARKNIQNLKPYSSARHEFKGTAEIYLDANESPFDNGMNRYPDPLQWKVKTRLAELKKVQPENIFLGNGSDEAIDLLIRIFCEPKVDHIITLPPTYGMYQVSADINDVAVKKINLTADYQLDKAAILAAANEHSKLLFICSPNNPTGNNMDRSDVELVIKQFPGIVVVDEAYIDFSSEESAIAFIHKYPNVVVLQTFSKSWGMASIRLGQAFSTPEIIGLFNKVKPPYNVNDLTQQAAIAAFKKRTEVRQSVEAILRERSRLEDRFPRFSFVEEVFPSDANFLLVKVDAPQKIYDFLVTKGIIIRNRSSVVLCEDCLRITIGLPKENNAVVDAFKAWDKMQLAG